MRRGGAAVRITVQTVSDLSRQLGGAEFELVLPGGTVRDLLSGLKDQRGFDLAAHPHTMLFVNGVGCVDHSRRLKDGDHVALVPILAAG